MYFLFPGRHHMLTKFQNQYLQKILREGIDGQKIDEIIFAITSANHENTRRNPIPLYLRALAIDKFSRNLSCKISIYPIKDIPYSDKYAQFLLSQIFYQSGKSLNPQNTILGCSTPPVISLFEKLGFKNTPFELIDAKTNQYSTLRPYEVIDLLIKDDREWDTRSAKWKESAFEATQEIYSLYKLGDLLIELFKDSLLTEDADITETRNYDTYALGMDNVTPIKFQDIKPFVIEGKIVDVGCSTGSLIKLLAKEFKESDIIGIEAVRKFYEYAKMQDYENPFVFFYRRNVTDQNFKDNTINNFIYSSVLHEVYSYMGSLALEKVLQNTYKQLAHGGRIIIRDVVGPEDGDKLVHMRLNKKDGKKSGPIEKLSTFSKFFQFVNDFKPRKINYELTKIKGEEFIKLRLKDAYEYISKMTYTDNWESEMHEEFGFYSFQDWCNVLKYNGFDIVAGSKSFKNSYIIKSKYKNRVVLYNLNNKNKLIKIAYPPTNMILVGKKSY